jgi:hypothetical protein
MAVISLDSPPSWWKDQASDHLTANEARKYAETDGKLPVIIISAARYFEPVLHACGALLMDILG